MRELFLIPLLAIILIAVYFMMKKLDRILSEQRQASDLPCPVSHTSLRIGLLSPAAADGIEAPLRNYAQQYPGVDVSLFYGTEEALLRELAYHRLDVIFVTAGVETPAEGQLDGREISWMPDAETEQERGRLQRVFWNRRRRTPEVSCFLACISSGRSLNGNETQAVL